MKFISRTLMILWLPAALAFCDGMGGEPKPLKFANDQFQVVKPSSWKLMDDLNDSADLEFGSDLAQGYGIIMTESKEDFVNMNLQKYSAITREPIREGITMPKETGPVAVNSEDYKGIRYELAGVIDGLNVIYWHVSLETDNHFHQILLWSIKSRFESNKEDFQTIINSFEPAVAASSEG